MPTAILFLLMFQAGIGDSPMQVQMHQPDRMVAVSPDRTDESPAVQALCEECDLLQHMQRLSRALNAFATTYKAGRIDLKQVKAVRKAMHDLEKSEWFQPQKAK